VGCNSVTSAVSKVTIVASPTVNITTSTPETCVGNEVQLKADINGGAGNCKIQWQTSNDRGVNWEDVQGATIDTFITPPKITSDMRFRARVICSGSGCCQ
jgi:hypothetical protein